MKTRRPCKAIVILILATACLLSAERAWGFDVLVFDFEPDKSFSEEWAAAALTDYTIRMLNNTDPGSAMPRDRLQRLVARWSRTSRQISSFETRDAIRQHVGAKLIIEGSLAQDRNEMIFTGTLINPDTGAVHELSFSSKNFDLGKAQNQIKLKLEKALGSKLKAISPALLGTKDTDAYILYWKGIVLYERGDPEKALPFFEQASGRDDSYIEPRLMAGRIMLEKALFSQAAEQFRRIAKKAPSDPRAHFLLGLTCSLQRQNAPALESLKRATTLDPGNPEYHYQLGQFYKDTYRYSEAIPELRKAVEIDQSLFDAWYQLALIHAVMKQEKQTLDCLEKATRWGGQEILKKMRNDGDFEWLSGHAGFQSLLLKPVRP